MKALHAKLFLQALCTFIVQHASLRTSFPNTWIRGRRFPFIIYSSASSPNIFRFTSSLNPPSGDYDYKYWSKAFRSQLKEFDYTITDVEGQLPADFQGTLFRNMPALFERGETKYGHYLDGDGYVIRVTFADGKVHFKSSYVKTEEYVAEKAANKVLYRSTFRTQRPALNFGRICLNNGFDLKLKNLANTNIIYWGGKLLTLFEAGVPYELDSSTLHTIGQNNMGISYLKSGIPVRVDKLLKYLPSVHQSIFGACATAHPKVDPVRNTLVSWLWRAVPRPTPSYPMNTNAAIEIFEWDKDWKTSLQSNSTNTDLTPVGLIFTNSSMNPHDFSITENYYVFVENRVSGDTIPYLFGLTTPATCIDINPSEPMILHLVPRHYSSTSPTKSQRARFSVPLTPGFTIHSACAFENNEEGTLEVFTTGWNTQTVASGGVKGGLLGSWEGSAPQFENIPQTFLYRTVVDTTTGILISHEPAKGMEKVVVEHPHINPQFETSAVRYIYMSIGSITGQSSPPLGYLRLDLVTGEQQIWYAPQHTYCEEVVIVPKKISAGLTSPEDDVWVVATMFDAVIERSCVCVFDGKSVDKGPSCRLWFQHGLPHSLHGCFTAETFL